MDNLENRDSVSQVSQVDAEKQIQGPSPPSRQALAGTGILVVEDNLFCAYAITSLFEQYSVACEVANNGKKALEMV